ncbi:MAG: DUF4276 family protein [Armatimonadetes bacterium]|nr:DUF4276 family protein [Armatimonadota bacterium]
MSYFVVVAEGGTERRVLGPLLQRWLATRFASAPGVKVHSASGLGKHQKLREQLARLTPDAPGANEVIAVISLLDLHGCGLTFPPSYWSLKQRIRWATRRIETGADAPRFHHCFAVHEVEAWLLAQPEVFPAEVRRRLRKLAVNPEEVDDLDPPAARISEAYRGALNRAYEKVRDGARLFGRLDPEIAASRCPNLRLLLDLLYRCACDFGVEPLPP